MLNLGGMEILVILVVALLVLGPEKLPSVMRSVGKAVGELRRASTEFQRTMNAELAITETKKQPESAGDDPTKTDLDEPDAVTGRHDPDAAGQPRAEAAPESAPEKQVLARARRIAPKPRAAARRRPHKAVLPAAQPSDNDE